MHEHHERRFKGELEHLRAASRVARLEVDRVVALCLEGLPAAHVIDVGTGTGLFAEAFLAAGCTVVGVDPNEAMLERARQLVPGAMFREGVAEALPYPDKHFDLAFLGTVLHETDDAPKALTEARRVARHRVAVLEFPEVEEGEGPPLGHRLSPHKIVEMAEQARFSACRHVGLARMELFLLSP